MPTPRVIIGPGGKVLLSAAGLPRVTDTSPAPAECCCGECACCIGGHQPSVIRLTISGVAGGGCCGLWNATFELHLLGPGDPGYAVAFGCVSYGIDLGGTDLADCYPRLLIV